MHTARRTILALTLGLLAAGCTFEPPAGAPTNLALGAPCTDDRDCASRVCTGSATRAGECTECRAGSACPAGRACDAIAGRCVPDQEVTPRHASTQGGLRRRNDEGRVHVGRVSATPVTTISETSR
ncbi:hypothetical protein L6R52_01890 [Myxococcota bacterium]|nr:hypothetical protein [Myxococcota bacterium]